MTSRLFGVALVLGLLTAVGPFAIDMYLPALPGLQQGLDASVEEAQWSLMAFFIAVAMAQGVYGPLSDMFGRKPPLYFGLCLFALASLGCALAPDIHTLIVCRFVQGLGACAGMVIPRAVVRDMYTGVQAARLMALLMLVFSVSPILSPLVGSVIIQFASWRGIFWAVMVAAAIGLLLTRFVLEETRPVELRVNSNVGTAIAAYRTLLRDRTFVGLAFIGAFGTGSFLTYLANSSFVLIDYYGLTPTQYSLAFSINAVAFIGAAQCTGWLSERFGLHNVVATAVSGCAATMVLLTVLTIMGGNGLATMMVLLFIGYGFMGFMIPATAVLALDRHGSIAGTASALMGTFQFVTGALAIAVVSQFFDGTSAPMIAGIAGCALCSFLIAMATLRGIDKPPAAQDVVAA